MYNDWYNLYLQQQETNENLEAIQSQLDELKQVQISGDQIQQEILNNIYFQNRLSCFMICFIMCWLAVFGLIRK